jgi:hypothetical protein
MGDTVFINGRAAVHKGSAGKAIAFPDVCLCPPGPPSGPVPVPLTNTVQAKDLAGGASTVSIEGNPIGHSDSYFATSTGDEVAQSTGGGVVTHVVQGKAYFQTFSDNVLIEGKPAVRHGDLLTHNHMARMPGNTPPSVWMSAVCPGAPPVVPRQGSKRANEGNGNIDVMLMDLEGNPLAYEPYAMTTPTGAVLHGRTLLDGGIHLRRIKKGKCKLTLPKRDAEPPRPPLPPAQQAAAAIPYKPGNPLALDTDKTHEVAAPVRPSLWLHLDIRPSEPSAQDDRFILRSTDGSFEVVLTVRDHRKRGAVGLTLEFPNLRSGLTYKLIHDLGGEGELKTLFDGLTYEDLFRKEAPASE